MGLQWYPKYPGDYARKTRELSMLEHGAYNLLMDHYYSTAKALPYQCSSNAELMPDHSRLYRVCNAVTQAERDAVDFILANYFEQREGSYYNSRIEAIILEQLEKHARRVAAGKKGAKSKANSNAKSNAPVKPKQPEPEPEPESKSKKTITKKEQLENLSLDDVKNWLSEKRAGGKYLTIDEHRLLEMFKDYCRSTKRGMEYKDFVSAFRNAFEWHNAPTKGDKNARPTTTDKNRESLQRWVEQGG